MILSPRERLEVKNTFPIVGNVDSSLKFQLKKIKNISAAIETILDKPKDTWYIESDDFGYNIDFLINGFSTLIEYYHTWVLQKHIGLINPECKITYKAIKKNDIMSIEKLLKNYGVGTTNYPELYSFDFYEECKLKYISAMSQFFIGKNHEIFVLNNYIKHNQMMRNFSPLYTNKDETFSFTFLYIDEIRANLLNRSLFRLLFDLSVDDLIKGVNDELYGPYIKNSEMKIYKMGGIDIVEINGLEYVKIAKDVGISIESMLETIKYACVGIIDVMLDEERGSGSITSSDIDDLTKLKSSFMERKAKTLNKVLSS